MAGLYNAAFRLVMLIQIVAQIAGNAFVVEGARNAATSDNKRAVLYNSSWRIGLLLGSPTACGMWFIANDLITWFYPVNFSEATQILQTLTIVVWLSVMRLLLGGFLTLDGRQVTKLRVEWIAAIAIIVVAVTAVSLAGIMGVVWAVILGEVYLLCAFTWILRHLAKIGEIMPTAIASTCGCATMLLSLHLLDAPYFIADIMIGSGIYLITVILFSSIRQNELSILRKLLS